MTNQDEEDEVNRLFEECGAVRKGHFIATSRKHLKMYVFLKDEKTLEIIAKKMAPKFVGRGIDIVVGPAEAGEKLAYKVARELSILEGREVRAVGAKKVHPTEKLGFFLEDPSDVDGKNVAVVEDVLTTGGSARDTVTAVKGAGGHVLVVAAGANREGVTAEVLGCDELIYLTRLANIDTRSWTHDACLESGPCSEGIPIDLSPGHGAAFLKEQEAWKSA